MAIAKVADRATANSNAGVTTVDLVLTGLTVGNHLVIRTAADNSGGGGAARTLTVTNQSGTPINTGTLQQNSSNQDPGAASAGTTLNLVVAEITATSGTVRLTYSGSVVQACVVEEWSGGGTFDTFATGGGGVASTTISGFHASATAGQLCYVAFAIEGPGSDSITGLSADYSALTKLGTANATADANQTTYAAYRIAGASSPLGASATLNNARDSAGLGFRLNEASLTLVVVDAAHGHEVEAVALTQVHDLTVADAFHGHAVDNVGLTQQHSLVVADAVHEHEAEPVVLDAPQPQYLIGTFDAGEITAGANVEIRVVATAASSTTAQIESIQWQTIVLSPGVDLVVSDAFHGHVVDGFLTGTLPTLLVNGNGDGTTYQPRNWATQSYLDIDEGIAAADGSEITGPAMTTGSSGIPATSFLLQDMPVDFAGMITLNVQARLRSVNRVDDSISLLVRILDVDGNKLAGDTYQIVEGNPISATVHNTAVVAFAYVNTSGSKAQWDGAVLELVQSWVAGGTPDSTYLAIDSIEFTGTYKSTASLSLVQNSNLVVADAVHAHAVDTTTLTQIHDLVVADVTHEHSAESLPIQRGVLLDPGPIETGTGDFTLGWRFSVDSDVDITGVRIYNPTSRTVDWEMWTFSGVRVRNGSVAVTADTWTEVEFAPYSMTSAAPMVVAILVPSTSYYRTSSPPSSTLRDPFNYVTGVFRDGSQGNIPPNNPADRIYGLIDPMVTATITQVHNIAVNDAAHDHTAESPTIALGSANVDPANAFHEHAVDPVALTQAHSLVVDDASHGHVVDPASLTQVHGLVVADVDHAHSVESVTISVDTINLVVVDAFHDHGAENVALTQLHLLAAADAFHGHSVEHVTLDQQHFMALADIAHEHTVEAVLLVQQHFLVVFDADHQHAVETVALTQVHDLLVNDAAHDHTVDSIAISQVHSLVVTGADHAHSVESVTISVDTINLVVNDAFHAHVSDNVTLTQDHTVVVADAAHTHAVDAPLVEQQHQLAGLADNSHEHTVEAVLLTQVHNLTPQNVAHEHAVGAPALTQLHGLVLADAAHGHAVDNIALTQVHELVVVDAVHAHDVEAVSLGVEGTLGLSDVIHGHVVESTTVTLVDTAVLYADAHLAGTVSTPANALGAPDGNWTNNAASWDSRFSMENTPATAVLDGPQPVRVRARKTAAGTGTPTITVELWENGVFVKTLVLNQEVAD